MAAFPCLISCSLTSLVLEAALWGFEIDLLQLKRIPVGTSSLFLLGIAAFTGWLTSGLILHKGLRSNELRLWVRAGVVLLSSCPMVGLLLVAAWRFVDSERTPWAYRLRTVSGTATRPEELRWLMSHRLSRPFARLRRHLERSPVLVVLLPAWHLLGAPWLAGLLLRVEVAAKPWVLLLAAGSVHLLAFTSLRLARLEPETQVTRLPKAWIGWTWWLPSPIPQTTSFFFWAVGETEKRTLSWTAFARLGGVDALPTWLRLQRTLAASDQHLRWWERARDLFEFSSRPQLSVGDQRFGALCRLKTGLLALDGVALGMVTPIWLRSRFSGPLHTLPIPTDLPTQVLALSQIAFAVWVVQIVRRYRPGGPKKRPATAAARYFFYSQGVLALAFQAGLYCAHRNTEDLGRLVAISAALWTVLIGFGLILAAINHGADLAASPAVRVLWCFLAFSVAFLGVNLAVGSLQLPDRPLLPAIILSLTASVSLALATATWLLSPFSITAALSPALPTAHRAGALIVILTLILPLGGLAVPLWIGLRPRLRQALAAPASDSLEIER